MSRYNLRLRRFDSAGALQAEFERIGADPRGIAIMAPKVSHLVVSVEGLKFAAASILKQELLSKGGDVALSGEIYFGGERTTNALMMASERALRRVIRVLRVQPLPSLVTLAAELDELLAYRTSYVSPSCAIGRREFAWGERTYVMGIVNATPDSFSGDGLLVAGGHDAWVNLAVTQALDFVNAGADIIDIGGESTRPGADWVDAETEAARVVPVIRAIRAQSDVPISIDTYKARVAFAALDVGADCVNDVWGLEMDPDMASVVAEAGVPVVLMHNRSKPRNAEQRQRLGGRYVGVVYEDLMGDVVRDLRGLVERANEAGIATERIIIDPGIGFGKTVEQNLTLLNHLDELRALGMPILLGSSRKSFIGYTLDLPPDQRVEGTAATVVMGIARGADIVRVHDVQTMVRVARMTDAILGADAL